MIRTRGDSKACWQSSGVLVMPGSGCQGNKHNCVDVFMRLGSVFAVEPRTVVTVARG